MIVANSPLQYAAPGPTAARRFAPPRLRLPSFRLGFRSPDRRRMELLRWFGGGQGYTAISDAGGEDMVAPAAKTQDHLVIMVNGINGSSADWRYGAEQFAKQLPDVLVHCSECNYSTLTFQGVDEMGKRLADEVRKVVKEHRNVQNISFVAHSLGGLVARYAIGKLYKCASKSEASDQNDRSLGKENTNSSLQSLDQSCQGTIAGLQPINFVTVATPHLGSKGNKQLPFLCGLPFLERRASQAAHFIVGRSGKHLFLTDNDNGEPLLLRMVDDSDDVKFMSALRVFKRRVAYANANYDHMVGWRTSSIRRQSELPKLNDLVSNSEYPHIVYVEPEHSGDMHNKLPSNIDDPQDELEEKMIRGLTQVPWERVDVSFQKSRQRFIAHNTIQVKRYWLNSDGADVVNHIIDYCFNSSELVDLQRTQSPKLRLSPVGNLLQ